MFTFDDAEVGWVLVPSGAEVHPQVRLDADYIPDYHCASYDYDLICLLNMNNWTILNYMIFFLNLENDFCLLEHLLPCSFRFLIKKLI